MYYAEYCPYGVRTNGGEKLYVFNTRMARDAWTLDDDWFDPKKDMLTRREAVRKFGKKALDRNECDYSYDTVFWED